MKPDKLFCDGVVFAENKPVRVFGTGDLPVTVKFCGAETTAAPGNGKWTAELPPMPAGGPYVMEISDGETKAEIKNVYIGIVYLVAGQSNAEFRLCESSEPESNYEDDPLLHNYFVARPWYDEDPFAPGGGWRGAKKESVGGWSAIAYLAGRHTRRLTGKPVGVISCSQGASIIESWLPAEIAEKFKLEKEQLMIDHFYPDYSAWNKGGVIYEKMLSPLFPFSLNGVIWYQGESDTTVAEGNIYDEELLCLMKVMRTGFKDPSLRFAVIQIADYDQRREYDPDGWVAIQKAQQRAVNKDFNSKLVISADVCESTCIHPTHKTELSERAAEALI